MDRLTQDHLISNKNWTKSEGPFIDGLRKFGDPWRMSMCEPDRPSQQHCRIRTGTVVLVVAGILGGCAASHYPWPPGARHDPAIGEASATFTESSATKARSLPMFRGDIGLPVTWDQLLQATRWADVIVIGEQHDDAVGHAVQLAVIQDVLAQRAPAAVSMEMLERDEQPLVDDYIEGIIDAATLAKLTFSETWAGENSWTDWYQPMLYAAKAAHARVVAANAPRRYVRLARTDGYARLRSLPPERRRLFDLPHSLSDDGYRKRFFDLMSEGDGAHGTPDPSGSGFRSQQVWDATMAASIVRALRAGSNPVIHVVGQFHSDFNGGMVQQIRSRSPRVKILVISMQRDDGAAFRDEDLNRADVIIYTGKPPPEPETTDEVEKSDEESTPTPPPQGASDSDAASDPPDRG